MECDFSVGIEGYNFDLPLRFLFRCGSMRGYFFYSFVRAPEVL